MQPSIVTAPSPIDDGKRLDREEFMDYCEELPDLKFAELIGGKVHLWLFTALLK